MNFDFCLCILELYEIWVNYEMGYGEGNVTAETGGTLAFKLGK